MAGVGLDTNLKRSDTGSATAASVNAAASTKKVVTETRSLPIDEVKLSAGAKAMLKQAKDGEEAVRLFSAILRKGKNSKTNAYDGLLWGRGIKGAEQAAVSGEGQNKVDSAAEEAKKREEFLNPPYDLKTGVWNGRIRGTPTTQAELGNFYAKNMEGLKAIGNGMPDGTDRDKFFSALYNRTLKIQHAEDVPGLNFRLNETRSWNEHGGSTQQSLSYARPSNEEHSMVGWTEGFGGHYITWD